MSDKILRGLTKHKTYTTYLVIFILVIAWIVGSFGIVEIYRDKQLNNEWYIIERVFEDALEEAHHMNEVNVGYIERKIKAEYGDDVKRLENDLANMEDGNKLLDILRKSIEGDIIFDMDLYKKDNNDPFYMDWEKLIADLSANCAIDGATVRSYSQEISGQFNKVLARNALYGMRDGGQEYYIWHYLQVRAGSDYYNMIKNLQYVDMDILKEKFYESNGDYRVLEKFEFLVPMYIYRDKDLAGNEIISASGHKQNNYQLILVQGFNIVDILEHFNHINHIKNTHKNINFITKVIYFVNFLLTLVSILGLVVIAKTQNKKTIDETIIKIKE